ncbi:MAG: tRNA (guanosine(46)-N7)-methyltransferase TrmB [Malacoplasma sp.]
MGRLRKNTSKENVLFGDNYYYISEPKKHLNLWSKDVFQNDNPIHIEIGCGKGNFIFNKALANPKINFIAIDKFATVIFSLLKKIKTSELKNLKLVCICATQIEEIFAHGEISKLYLNFSDPWPKKKHAKRRLTHNSFLIKYFDLLMSKGQIEFKTDSELLYNYTLETIIENNYKVLFKTIDLYNSDFDCTNEIKTEYEIKWMNMGIKIKKIIFEK